MTKTHLMTADALAARLEAKYGEGGMSASAVYKELHIRKSKLPDGLETVINPGNTRKRYAPGSMARWYTSGRSREAVRV